MGCPFSKFCAAVPLRDITSETVANAIISHWVSYFGVMKELHSDKGRQFESDLLGIDKTRTTTRNPQRNGWIENCNKTICNRLNCVVQDNPFSWDLLLRLCMLAYKSSEQQSTKETPMIMKIGRQALLPTDLVSPYRETNAKFQNPEQFVLALQSCLHDIHAIAPQYMKNATFKQAESYNHRLQYNSYARGDQVYYFYPVKGKM